MRILKKENEEDKNACDLQAFFVLHLRCPLSGFPRIGQSCPMRVLPWEQMRKDMAGAPQKIRAKREAMPGGTPQVPAQRVSSHWAILPNAGASLGSECEKIWHSLSTESAPSGAKCRTAGARTFGVSSPSAEASHESTCLKASHLFSIGCAKREAVPEGMPSCTLLFSALLFSSFLFFSLSRDVSIFVRFVYIFA